MQVVMKIEQVFSRKSWKKIGADPSSRSGEKCKNAHFNYEKWRHRAEGEKIKQL